MPWGRTAFCTKKEILRPAKARRSAREALAIGQDRTPLFTALREYVRAGVLSFHVPGHKHGRGLPELARYLGRRTFYIDLTVMPDLDSIFAPHGVIKEAQELAAAAFRAGAAHFIVNGTTAGVQAMILAACRPGDKIILPRNVHKSVLGALILSGAEPVYIPAQVNARLGIAMGIETQQVEHALRAYPEAKAVFVINPTYYGVASDLPAIVASAHAQGVPVLVDEAHGGHFYFHPSLPPAAMDAGADMAAVSVHKMLGSLTQSSLLLQQGDFFDPAYVKEILNLTQTTSPSYVLMASLDVARKQAYRQGEKLLTRTLNLAHWARRELNTLDGLYVFGAEIIGQPGCAAYDPTKLCIHVRGLGLSGSQAGGLLRRDYRIQVELTDPANVLALVTLGDDKENLRRLVSAFQDLSRRFPAREVNAEESEVPPLPEVALLPQEAFYAAKRPHEFKKAAGKISGELIMAYPPGIPIICPGEIITEEVLRYVRTLKEKECLLQGMQDHELERILVIK